MGIADHLPKDGRDFIQLRLEQLADIAMPGYLADWILDAQRQRLDDSRVRRARRFVDHWSIDSTCADETVRAWSTLAKSARSADDLIALFATFPDGPELEPYALVHGERHIDAGEERKRLRRMAKYAAALRDELSTDRLRTIAADASATGAAEIRAYRELSRRRLTLIQGLSAMGYLGEHIDPSAKLLSPQYAANDAAVRNYRHQVSALNGYLTARRHAQLCVLARINCPAYPLATKAIEKVWSRSDKVPPAI